jgi:hypothetical protein
MICHLSQKVGKKHSRRVSHQLRLMTCEDDQTVYPRSIANLRSSEQKLVRTERDLFRYS